MSPVQLVQLQQEIFRLYVHPVALQEGLESTSCFIPGPGSSGKRPNTQNCLIKEGQYDRNMTGNDNLVFTCCYCTSNAQSVKRTVRQAAVQRTIASFLTHPPHTCRVP